MTDTPHMRAAAVEGSFGFILAIRDQVHGLSFWNNDYGFGPLFNATVFGDSEAAGFALPITQHEPEWLAMPPPLRTPS